MLNDACQELRAALADPYIRELRPASLADFALAILAVEQSFSEGDGLLFRARHDPDRSATTVNGYFPAPCPHGPVPPLSLRNRQSFQ